MADLPSRRLLALVLAAGVLVPGLLQYLLERAGYPLAADAVWVAGYGGTVLVVWYGWLRPLDLRGPSG